MGAGQDFSHIPVIDVSDLVAGAAGQQAVAAQLGTACRESGFFYVVGHGVDDELQLCLERLSRQFFAQDLAAKLDIRMERGGQSGREDGQHAAMLSARRPLKGAHSAGALGVSTRCGPIHTVWIFTNSRMPNADNSLP